MVCKHCLKFVLVQVIVLIDEDCPVEGSDSDVVELVQPHETVDVLPVETTKQTGAT